MDLYDLASFAQNWLSCTTPGEADCLGGHDSTSRNELAIQTVYRSGVPHTGKHGQLRITYDPQDSIFPIGAWGVPMPDGGGGYDWNVLVANGYNVVWPFVVLGETPATILQTASQAGIQVVLMGGFDVSTIQVIKNHPNLLGNVWKDEPLQYYPSTIQAKYDEFVEYRSNVKAVAPNLPVFVNNWTESSGVLAPWFAQWGTAGDVFCLDNYPVRVKLDTFDVTPSGLLEGVSFAAAHSVGDGRPVWVIIGAFARNEPWDWSSLGYRFPTPRQLRCQVYAAIIHGATGIHYYIWDSWISRSGLSIGASPDPVPKQGGEPHLATPTHQSESLETWLAVAMINSELTSLTPSLLSPTAGSNVAYHVSITGQDVSSAPIRTLLKQDPSGGYILLTVNVDYAVLNVQYTFENEIANVIQMFDNSSSTVLEADERTFQQNYEPFSVHIFHIDFVEPQ